MTPVDIGPSGKTPNQIKADMMAFVQKSFLPGDSAETRFKRCSVAVDIHNGVDILEALRKVGCAV